MYYRQHFYARTRGNVNVTDSPALAKSSR